MWKFWILTHFSEIRLDEQIGSDNKQILNCSLANSTSEPDYIGWEKKMSDGSSINAKEIKDVSIGKVYNLN